MDKFLFFVCAILAFCFTMETSASSLTTKMSKGRFCYGGNRGGLFKMPCPGSCYIFFDIKPKSDEFGCLMSYKKTGWYHNPNPLSSHFKYYICNVDFCNNESVEPRRALIRGENSRIQEKKSTTLCNNQSVEPRRALIRGGTSRIQEKKSTTLCNNESVEPRRALIRKETSRIQEKKSTTLSDNESVKQRRALIQGETIRIQEKKSTTLPNYIEFRWREMKDETDNKKLPVERGFLDNLIGLQKIFRQRELAKKTIN